MKPSLRLGRVAGIEVDLHWSVAVIMLLFAWSLADATLPDFAPGYSDGAYWLAAGLAVVVLFASLLAHELAHSVVARRVGVDVEHITLWLFGGVSQLHGESPTPSAELRVAGAGPLTSVGLGLAFGTVAVLAWGAGAPDLAVATIGWLGGINLLLAVFNLIPGAPLDGGRLLHARIWRQTGSREAATAGSTRAGVRVGHVLIGVGIVLFLLGDFTALWFAFLGWFLMNAARAEATNALLQGALANVRVRDVMTPDPITVPARASVAMVVDDWFMRHTCSAFPVVDEGVVTGLITLAKVRSIDRAQWSTLEVADVAEPRAAITVGSPEEPIAALLERMSAAHDHGAGRALIFDGDQLVGIVSSTDVRRAIDLAALRTPAGRAAPAVVSS